LPFFTSQSFHRVRPLLRELHVERFGASGISVAFHCHHAGGYGIGLDDARDMIKPA